MKLKSIKKITAFSLSVSLMFTCLVGCNGSSESENSKADDNTSNSSSNTDAGVTVKTYEFPEFLSDSEEADVLSNVIYQSFDSAAAMTEPETQPFDDYKCTAVFHENYYIFTEDEHYGLINSIGTELVSYSGLSSFTAVSEDTLLAVYDDGSEIYYRVDGVGGAYTITIDEFDDSRISAAAFASDDETGEYYLLQLDEATVYDVNLSSFKKADIDDIDTGKSYEAIYTATSGNEKYYIAFDEFYNFTVYEGDYAYIELKIGGEYGSCYVLDYDDFTELETLISSFGSESKRESPSKDEDADYVQITMELASGTQVKTISSEGYCFTDTSSTDSSVSNKYFTLMDTETFVDLVNWIDITLGS